MFAAGRADRTEPAGPLGLELLARYWQEREPEPLADAIGLLREAVDTEPDDGRRAYWRMYLGQAYGDWAALTRDLTLYDRAIELVYHQNLAGSPGIDPETRADSVVLVAELSWNRYRELAADSDFDDPVPRSELSRLVARLAELMAVGYLDAESTRYVRRLHGLSYLDRFLFSDDPADLQRGITDLDSALAGLAPTASGYAYAHVRLADAYRARGVHDRSVPDLDRSVEGSRAAIAAMTGDWPEWTMAHRTLAYAYAARWEVARQPDDLDRAAACWPEVLPDGDPTDAVSYASVLRERAEHSGGGADAAEAIRLLAAAVDELSSEDAWLGWSELGRAYYVQWRLAGDGAEPADLDRAAAAADRALASTLPTMDDLLRIHLVRVPVATEILERDVDRPVPGQLAPVHHQQCMADAYDALTAVLGATPGLRAQLAGDLVAGELVAVIYTGALPTDRIRELLTLAATRPDPAPDWLEYLELGRTLLGVWSDRPPEPTPGAPGRPDQADHRLILSTAAFLRATATGDLRGRRAAARSLREALSRSRSTTDTAPPSQGFELIATLLTGLDEAHSGDLAGLTPVVARLRELQVGLTQPTYGVAGVLGQLLAQWSATVTGESVPELPVGPDAPLAQRMLALASRAARAQERNDLPVLRESARSLAELAELTPPGRLVRLGAAGLAGHINLKLAQRDPTDRVAVQQAVRWFDEALRLVGGVQQPTSAVLAIELADSLRRVATPDLVRSRQVGWFALHSDAWQVIRQSGTDHALEAARAATNHAYLLAGWCMEDKATAELVAVLDAGRGLVLSAATASRDIAGQLAEDGHPALAQEWRNTAGLGRDRRTGGVLGTSPADHEVPDDLRLRALAALRPDRPGRHVLSSFEPLQPQQVQQDLTTLRADALVYLMPSLAGGKGLAVVIPASGPVHTIWLPALIVGPDTPMNWYLGAGPGARDIGPVDPTPGREGRDLDALCRWAWTAATGPLIDHVRRWRLRRPARLVIVAMSMLALVPWHAAYTGRGAGRRYAVQDLVISYAVSARMLHHTAQQPSQEIRSALVVGDPTGDLAAAGVEARAIHERFYQHGAFFGQPAQTPAPAGSAGGAAGSAGTPAEVLAWVRSAAPGPSLLHFACHGRVDPGNPAGSHLVLAGGERLAVRDLLETSRLAELTIDTVFLAACSTGAGGEAYDEALSLATGFLAAGARTVFGTLWPVPDAATSLLMFMVHHHLVVDAAWPADALHRAQRWMLDADRRPPPGMPAELVGLCSRPETADPVSWAGFTHLGR